MIDLEEKALKEWLDNNFDEAELELLRDKIKQISKERCAEE